jgi:hypothetical protein
MAAEAKFIPLHYTELPPKSIIVDELEEFNVVFGKKARKAGSVKTKAMSARYPDGQVFKKLTDDSIFCTAPGSIAVKIEEMLKEVLVEQDICANIERDSQFHRATEDDEEKVVYLVEINKGLVSCPLKRCHKAFTEEAIERHIESHPQITKMKALKAKLSAKGIKDLDDIPTKPIKYYHNYYHSNKCRYCDAPFEGMNVSKRDYHQSRCKNNPFARFSCPVCGLNLQKMSRLIMHVGFHSRVDNKRKFQCQYCKKSFTTKFNKQSHEKKCNFNPEIIRNGGRQRVPCHFCGKMFLEKCDRDKHEKKTCKVNPNKKN